MFFFPLFQKMQPLTVIIILFIIIIAALIKSAYAHKLSLGSLYRCNKMRTERNMHIGNNFLNFWFIYNEIYENGDYEPFKVPDGGFVIDIGGNMGLFSSWADERMTNGTIFVFEPIPQLMNIIKHNTKNSNNIIKYFNMGLGDEEKTVEIQYYPHANGLSTTDMSNKKTHLEKSILTSFLSKVYLRDPEYIEVNIVRLDSLKDSLPDVIDFVKIDVEGFEFEVLKGFGALISRVQVFIIEVEAFKQMNLFEIIRLLQPTHYIHLREDDRHPWNMVTAIRKSSI